MIIFFLLLLQRELFYRFSIRKLLRALTLSLSLSFSLTHTYTHTLSLLPSHSLCLSSFTHAKFFSLFHPTHLSSHLLGSVSSHPKETNNTEVVVAVIVVVVVVVVFVVVIVAAVVAVVTVVVFCGIVVDFIRSYFDLKLF